MRRPRRSEGGGEPEPANTPMSNAAAVGRRRGGKRSDALVGRALLVMGAAAVAFVIGAVVR